jgi:hypothetical protein
MPAWLEVLLYFAALICFVVAAFAPERVRRINLIALGLALWVFVPFSAAIDRLG